MATFLRRRTNFLPAGKFERTICSHGTVPEHFAPFTRPFERLGVYIFVQLSWFRVNGILVNARIVQLVKNSSGACGVNVACVFLNYWLSWTYCPCKHEAFNRLNWFEVLFTRKLINSKHEGAENYFFREVYKKIRFHRVKHFYSKLQFWRLFFSPRNYIFYYFLTIELGKLKP